MNIYKVAILIDGSFFRKRFKFIHSKEPRANDVEMYIDNLILNANTITNKRDKHSHDVLFRAFYYECRAYGGKERRPDGKEVDFSKQPAFTASNMFLKDLKTVPQMALRLGDLSFDGWKINPKNTTGEPIPDFKQKSVDMKIGMDIAWMANKRTVDKIILVAGDSDFVSPMKYARKEGLLIYLDTMKQTNIKMILKEHSDFVF